MSYSIYDDDDQKVKPDQVQADIRRLGLDFISTAKTELGSSSYDNRDARDIKQARYDAKTWLIQTKYNPLTIWRIFEAVYKDSIHVNAWSGDIFLGSISPINKTNIGTMLNRLEDILDTALPLHHSFLDRRLDAMVKYRTFHPIENYLKGLPKLTPNDWAEWLTLADKLFGTSEHLVQVKLTRWLIGAVARAIEPGCKMDTALVIRGKQGIGKTSLLAALFGEHFRTLHSSQSQLEQQRNIQNCWGAELGELEATFRAKDISALKAFLTETHDSFRDLNKELGAPRPRHCVFAGTTNETAFLNDNTGSRRFWVIDAGDHIIPVSWVKANRDRIWAVAYHLYLAKKNWWLTPEEEELSERANKTYQTENPLEEPLRTALEILDIEDQPIAIKACDAARYFLNIAPGNLKRHERELKAAFTSLGYIRRSFGNKKLNGWHYVKPDVEDPTPFCLDMVDIVTSARLRNPDPNRRQPRTFS